MYLTLSGCRDEDSVGTKAASAAPVTVSPAAAGVQIDGEVCLSVQFLILCSGTVIQVKRKRDEHLRQQIHELTAQKRLSTGLRCQDVIRSPNGFMVFENFLCSELNVESLVSE